MAGGSGEQERDDLRGVGGSQGKRGTRREREKVGGMNFTDTINKFISENGRMTQEQRMIAVHFWDMATDAATLAELERIAKIIRGWSVEKGGYESLAHFIETGEW